MNAVSSPKAVSGVGGDRGAAVPAGKWYARIKADLHRQIVVGKLRPGDRMPTEKSLAALYGVSVLTVRQAQQALVQEGLIRKEQGRGTFVTEAAAKERRLLLVCGLSALEDVPSATWHISRYYQDSIRFCHQAARELGFPIDTFWPYAVAEGMTGTDGGDQLAAVSGVILLACADDNPITVRVRREGIYAVHMGKTSPAERSVWFDMEQAAQIAWTRMREEITRRRLRVVVASVEGEGRGADVIARRAPGRTLHLPLPRNLSLRDVERYGYQAIHELCARERKPMAFVFLDDVVARGGTRAMLQAGLGDGRCPVAVVCGKQEVEPYGLPITYITHDTEAEARWAVEMLDAQIRGDPAGIEPRQSLFALDVDTDDGRVRGARDENKLLGVRSYPRRQVSTGIERHRQVSKCTN